MRRAAAAGLLVAGLALAVLGCRGAEQLACSGVEYAGSGSPDVVVVSDLPLHGTTRAEALQINDAVRSELRARGFRAGAHTIGFQACDDSTVAAGKSDPGTCSENANAYADDDRVIAVVGPLDSRCAAILIPVLNQAPGGGIVLVSPTNTYPCLTRGGVGCDVSEPAKYYPSGRRNYLRLAANDVFQAAADAEFARDHGLDRVYVLHDDEAYGVGMATGFRNAARSLGVEVVGFEGWGPGATSYAPLLARVRRSGADAIFLGGSIDRDGARLLQEKVAALGPNEGAVSVLAPDGFLDPQGLERAGAAGDGMVVSASGVPTSAMPAAAKAYASRLASSLPMGQHVGQSVIRGAEAARVVLDAIARSDGTRADVIAKLFATRVTDGLLGTFRFDANGDPANASGAVVGFTFTRVGRRAPVEATLAPAPATVHAASVGELSDGS